MPTRYRVAMTDRPLSHFRSKDGEYAQKERGNHDQQKEGVRSKRGKATGMRLESRALKTNRVLFVPHGLTLVSRSAGFNYLVMLFYLSIGYP